VLHGHPASRPLSKTGTVRQFSAHVCCGQTAGFNKVPFSTKVGLGPGDIALYAEVAPLKRAQPPIFALCLLQPNGWMDHDSTWYGGRPLPRRHCVRWGANPPKKRHITPTFRPMSIVAKPSPISAPAEFLLPFSFLCACLA